MMEEIPKESSGIAPNCRQKPKLNIESNSFSKKKNPAGSQKMPRGQIESMQIYLKNPEKSFHIEIHSFERKELRNPAKSILQDLKRIPNPIRSLQIPLKDP